MSFIPPAYKIFWTYSFISLPTCPSFFYFISRPSFSFPFSLLFMSSLFNAHHFFPFSNFPVRPTKFPFSFRRPSLRTFYFPSPSHVSLSSSSSPPLPPPTQPHLALCRLFECDCAVLCVCLWVSLRFLCTCCLLYLLSVFFTCSVL